MDKKLDGLLEKLGEIYDLDMAGALLGWDQEVYMPPGGGAARARQLATLGKLAHEKRTDAKLGRLLDRLASYAESLPADSDEARLIAVARRDFQKAVKVPPSFVAQVNEHAAKTYDVWAKARPANDFKMVQPYLEKTLDLSRQYGDYFPGYEHIADPLIDDADEGMKASEIRRIFAALRAQLVPIAGAIAAQPPADDSCLRGKFPEAKQWAFGEQAIRAFGYDFQRGRQDKTAHPFTTSFSLGDVRITTRVKPDDLSEALFSTLHEAGHAMYEQGIRLDLESTPLASGTSSGVHESQSRLWENRVGRSLGFWTHFYPRLQAAFPKQLGAVPLDAFYRAINKVQRSLIRTDADEVTYNLHVMIRFDLELAMLEGKLAIKDLPEAWNARYQSDLGITPPEDRNGVLQDVHWYGYRIGGMFQGYTLGNILGAQFYEAALRAHPEIPAEIEEGKFGALHDWLKESIYQHGRKFTADELLRRVTGGGLDIAPYIRYLRGKYGEMYTL